MNTYLDILRISGHKSMLEFRSTSTINFSRSLLYLSGTGVEKNPGLSFAIANVAAAQGHNDAIQLRDRLMATLPADTLRNAQDLSVELFEQFTGGSDASARSRLK